MKTQNNKKDKWHLFLEVYKVCIPIICFINSKNMIADNKVYPKNSAFHY